MNMAGPLDPMVGGSKETTPRELAGPVFAETCWMTRTSVVLRLMFAGLIPVVVTIAKNPGGMPAPKLTTAPYDPSGTRLAPSKNEKTTVAVSRFPALDPALKIDHCCWSRIPVPMVVTRSPHCEARSVELTPKIGGAVILLYTSPRKKGTPSQVDVPLPRSTVTWP